MIYTEYTNIDMKCAKCNKKLLIEYPCKCKKVFCITHLYSDVHACTYDHKKDEKDRIQTQLEKIVAPKLESI
jgi:hypothetical protein